MRFCIEASVHTQEDKDIHQKGLWFEGLFAKKGKGISGYVRPLKKFCRGDSVKNRRAWEGIRFSFLSTEFVSPMM